MGAGVRPLCCRRWGMKLCSMRRGALRSPLRCIPPKNSVPHPAEPEPPPGASRASRTPGYAQKSNARKNFFSRAQPKAMVAASQDVHTFRIPENRRPFCDRLDFGLSWGFRFGACLATCPRGSSRARCRSRAACGVFCRSLREAGHQPNPFAVPESGISAPIRLATFLRLHPCCRLDAL